MISRKFGRIGLFEMENESWGSVSEQRKNMGKSSASELRLESICDDRLWIWILKLGLLGALNDVK